MEDREIAHGRCSGSSYSKMLAPTSLGLVALGGLLICMDSVVWPALIKREIAFSFVSLVISTGATNNWRKNVRQSVVNAPVFAAIDGCDIMG